MIKSNKLIRFQKALAVFTLLCVAAGCLVGCSGTSSSAAAGTDGSAAQPAVAANDVQHYLETGEITGEEVNLRWLHRFPSEDEAAYFQSLADEYTQMHPNVTIRIDTASDEAMKEKLRVMMGGGDVPDIYYSWSGEFAAKFVRAGAAIDLTPYQEADPEWKDSISEVYWNNGVVDGADYGVPFRFTGGAIMYNTKIFKELELSVPKTWAELEAVSQKLLDAGYTPMLCGNAQPWISAWWFTALFEQMVPEETRARDYNAATGEWTDPGYANALALMQDMYEKQYLNQNINSMTDDQATELFASGQGGMYYTGLYNFDPMSEKMGDENWDWFPFPAIEGAPGKTNTVVGAADLFMVSNRSAHPEVAVDFLKFLTSKENQTRLPAETWLTPVVTGSSTEENTSEKEMSFIQYVAQESNGFSEYLDTATDARVCDKLLENFQLLYDGKEPEKIMEETRQIAATVREAG